MPGGAQIRQVVPILREILAAPALRTAALLILPYAGLLVGLDVAARYGEITGAYLPAEFLLSQDLSFGEYLEYALMLAVAAMLFTLWRGERASPVYLVFALLFLVLAADNAFEAHEKFGFWIAPWMPQRLPIEPHHLGEPVLFGLIGLLWLAGMALALRASRPRATIHALILTACIGAMAFFGVLVDEIVVFGEQTVAMIQIEAFVEDGGEFALIILSFLLTTAIFDIERRRAPALGPRTQASELPLAA